jgi:PIN domain nuclease of toxin-antitoxin system
VARLLLDTHVLIWWLQSSPALSQRSLDAIIDSRNTVAVSAATIYEIAFKVRLGRLSVFSSPREALSTLGFHELPINLDHAERAASFQLTHRDPWDRLLAAQAIIEDMTVVTRDPEIAALGALTLW